MERKQRLKGPGATRQGSDLAMIGLAHIADKHRTSNIKRPISNWEKRYPSASGIQHSMVLKRECDGFFFFVRLFEI